MSSLVQPENRSGLIRRVFLEVTASPEQTAAVESSLRQAGFDVQAEAEIPLSGGAALPADWVVQITLAAPIAAFLTAFATEAGKDAYGAFSRWVEELVRVRGRNGEITLWDEVDTLLVLPAPLPDEAVDALRALEWDSIESHSYLDWDESQREWRIQRRGS